MTFLTTIDGHLLKEMVINGAGMLEKHKAAIDALNVFPVPDGDTGTNMSLTMVSAVKELAAVDSADASVVAAAIARGALKGARGNSGVILSQLFRGFSEGAKEHETIDAQVFAASLARGVEKAYKAVMKPREGTILTVARAVAENAQAYAEKNDNLYGFVEEMISSGNEMLKRTPDMLPVLKQAGVVDSGGAGLMTIYLGFKAALDGEEVDAVGDITKQLTALNDQQQVKPEQTGAASGATEDIEFGYCTETFITHLNEGVGQRDVDNLRSKLMEFGDCVLVVADQDMIKVHCHSNDPGRILRYCIRLGELDNVKVENMRTQHRTLIEEANAVQNKTPAIEKEVGFVAISAGDGIAAMFRDLTVNEIVQGGQTMNPSTEDIVQAIYRCAAKTTFVLPNNKNIIMAAEQCIPLTEKTVRVIPTRTVPQGVAALAYMDPDQSPDDLEESFKESAARVHTALVTYAARDSDYDGHIIHAGEYLALLDGKLLGSYASLPTLLKELNWAFGELEPEFLTVYYGQDVTETDANGVAESLTSCFPEADVSLVSGGQPVYYYMIAAE